MFANFSNKPNTKSCVSWNQIRTDRFKYLTASFNSLLKNCILNHCLFCTLYTSSHLLNSNSSSNFEFSDFLLENPVFVSSNTVLTFFVLNCAYSVQYFFANLHFDFLRNFSKILNTYI